MERKWKFAFGIAAANDLLDLTPAGASPVPSIFIDIVTNIVLWPALKSRRSLLTLADYIPVIGTLPIYTATVAYAYSHRHEDTKREIEVE
jgi:hypothetical protein